MGKFLNGQHWYRVTDMHTWTTAVAGVRVHHWVYIVHDFGLLAWLGYWQMRLLTLGPHELVNHSNRNTL